MRSIEFLREANPYQGADAAKFAAMSPADQEWYTRGGQKPDLSDPYIAMRAPNKGAAVVDAGATDMSLGRAGAANAANAAAGATDMSLGQAGAANAAAGATGATDMSLGQAGAANAADAAAGATDMSLGQAGAANAADAAAGATDMSLGQAGAANAAAGPAAPAKPTAPAANKAMTPAINAYASRMGLLTNNKPNVDAIKKFQTANGLKADGIIGSNTAGAILSAQKSGGPAATVQAATPAAPALPKVPPMPDPNRRTGTMAQRDAWIAKYGKTHNMDGTTKTVQGATPNLSPIDQFRANVGIPAGGTSPAAIPVRESTFQESVDLMRRLSTMLKG